MDIPQPSQQAVDKLPRVYFCAYKPWEPNVLHDEYVDSLATTSQNEFRISWCSTPGLHGYLGTDNTELLGLVACVV